jgi:hypothetical protein
MRSPCCLYVPQCLKSGIKESEENAVAMQRLAKHIPMSTNTHATVEVLDALFSVLSVSYEILDV